MRRQIVITIVLLATACGPGAPDPADADAGDDTAELAANGDRCIEGTDCQSGACLSDDDGWPDGHCTTTSCIEQSCPGLDDICAVVDEREVCVESCQPGQCRDGYACREVAVGRPGCIPEDLGIDPSDAFEDTRRALDFQCTDQIEGSADTGSVYGFEFEISERADSFLMVPMVDQGSLQPAWLVTPSGTEIDLRNDYRHHNTRIFEMNAGFELAGVGTYGQIALDWPIMVPYAPRFADYLEPGTYQLTLTTTSAPPCMYVLESEPGSTVDLNLYMVGPGDFKADTAREDEDLQEVLTEVDAIFEEHGISVGEVRFRDVEDDVRERYRRIRSQEDAYQLTAYGTVPGSSLDERLSVDLFLVEDIVFSGSGVLGLSAGLPGSAGLHGNARNGLVFRTVDLGVDNQAVAQILAHELAHFLGLRHTTERIFGAGGTVEQQYDEALGTYDPIDDTPVCSDIRTDWESCPDLENLMFPTAPPSDADFSPTLTPDQAEILRRSPLLR